MIETLERAAYSVRLFERKGNKFINKTFDARLDFGTKIITGFEKGTFGVDGKAFSCDASDVDYRQDWKELLVATASDVVSAVAQLVFEATGAARGDAEFVVEGD